MGKSRRVSSPANFFQCVAGPLSVACSCRSLLALPVCLCLALSLSPFPLLALCSFRLLLTGASLRRPWLRSTHSAAPKAQRPRNCALKPKEQPSELASENEPANERQGTFLSLSCTQLAKNRTWRTSE